MAGGTAEAQAGGQDARSLEDALVDAVADLDAKAADLAHGGQAVGEAVIGLLDGDGLLLEQRLHDPVGVIVGEVAGEVQVGVDEAGHDGLAGGVDDLVALRGVLVGASVLDLAILVDENQGVLDRLGAGAVDELAADDCVLLTHDVPPYWNFWIGYRHPAARGTCTAGQCHERRGGGGPSAKTGLEKARRVGAMSPSDDALASRQPAFRASPPWAGATWSAPW